MAGSAGRASTAARWAGWANNLGAPPAPAPASEGAYDKSATDSATTNAFALVSTSNVRWRVEIDWNNDSADADVFTGAKAVATGGTSIFTDYIIDTNAGASDVNIGDVAQLFDSNGDLKERAYFTVVRKESAFGFTNVFFTPPATEVTNNGDELRVVNTGGFSEDGDDVTERTLAESEVVIEFGRDQNRKLSPTASGRATLSLDNRSLDYSPDNLASPLAGNVLPARPLRIRGALGGTEYILFRGFYDDFDVKPDQFRSSVDIGALDPIAAFRDVKISTQIYKGIRTGQAINYVLDALGWPVDRRDIDTGATGIRWWWEQDSDGYEALQKIVTSEGPGAIVYADQFGNIVFRDRHHRLLQTRSITAQASFNPLDEPAYSELVYDHGWRDIINSVSIEVNEYDPSDEPEIIFEDPSSRIVPVSGHVDITIVTDDPVIEPTVTYDDTFATTSSFILDSGQRLTLRITAGGFGSVVRNLVVQARPVTSKRTFTITSEDTVSQGKYKKRDYPFEAPWAGVNDAAAIGSLIIGQYAERTPIVTATLKSSTLFTTTRLQEQLKRELSDRVHFVNDETALDHHFFIERIQHRISDAGLKLETEFGMERATVFPDNVFIFDKVGHGFDDGVFGQAGLDDPVNLFIFDQSGHGFDDGNFAT